MRKERKGEPILTLDAGDTIQGTPLAYYYAKIDPITEGSVHPMAQAMNLVGYDAAALGNHEFNYGIDTLRDLRGAAGLPAPRRQRGRRRRPELPAFPPYLIKTFKVGGGRALKVGVLGLTNPGIAIWDKANVEGKMEFPGLVEQAKKFVPRLKAKGCDLVVDLGPLRCGHLVVVRRRAAVPGERRVAGRRAGAATSTRSWSATRTRRSRSSSSATRRPGSRCCCASRRTGACGSR